MHGESRAEQMEKQDGVKRKLITEQSRNHGAEQKSRSREEITERSRNHGVKRSRNHGGKESRVTVQVTKEQKSTRVLRNLEKTRAEYLSSLLALESDEDGWYWSVHGLSEFTTRRYLSVHGLSELVIGFTETC